MPHQHWPPWPNGQGIGLLIRRLWARVPQGVLSFQDSTTFFSCLTVVQWGWLERPTFFSQIARARATWTPFLLLPLPLAQATSRQLFSFASLHPCNRHRGDSTPCGQGPMDFESISLAAQTQCLLPALCSPLSFGKHLLELLIGGAHLHARALSLPLHGCLATSTARPKRSNGRGRKAGNLLGTGSYLQVQWFTVVCTIRLRPVYTKA